MVTSFALNPNNCIKKQFSVGNTKAYFSIVVKIDMQGKNCNFEMFFFLSTLLSFPVIYDKSSHYCKDFFEEKIMILGCWSFANEQ